MPFARESTYFNRYNKARRYFDIRALAGEVPQSAEDNERVSLMRDLVQRLGEAQLQSGDVLSGMLATSVREEGSNRLFRVDSGALYVDGIVHEVDGGITNLAVPKTGWGFIGVYIRRDVVGATGPNADAELHDPAVHNGNGVPLGLPGANRTKLTPIWVAGPLVESDFDDLKAADMLTTQNSSGGYAGRMKVEVNTLEDVSTKGLVSSKITWPGTGIGAITQVTAKTGPNTVLGPLVAGMTIRADVKIKNAGSAPIRCSLNVFGPAGPKLVPSSIQTVNTGSGAVKASLSLQVTPQMLTDLGGSTGWSLGVIFESDTAFPETTEFYVADLHAKFDSDLRRPAYKLFTTALGTQYRNYMVGSAGAIKHGDIETTSLDALGRPNAQPTELASSISMAGIPSLPATLSGLDPVVRSTTVTPSQDQEFLAARGMTLEEGLHRIYPVHVTYNGEIISTLQNREFTRLTDNYLSERLSRAIPDSVLSGLRVTAIETAPSVYEQLKVDITTGEAFVQGRKFAVSNPPRITLPDNLSGGATTRTPSPEDSQDFVGTSYTYLVAGGSFLDLKNLKVTVLFKETVQHVQSSATDAFAPSTTLASLDQLRVKARRILKVMGPDAVDPTKTFQYVAGLDYDVVPRIDTQNGDEEVTVIGWHFFDAQGSGPNARRASRQPQLNSTYTIYYEALLDLTLPATGQVDSTQVSYVVENSTNVGFKLKAEDASLDSSTNNVQKLAAWTNPDPANLSGPFLVPAPGFLIGSGSGNQSNAVFSSLVSLYEYTTPEQKSFIIYLSGDVASDGPDGAFGYEPVGSDPGDRERAKRALLTRNRLPLALVTTPVTPGQIENYDLRQITLADQHRVNGAIDSLLQLLPTLLSQNMLGGDFGTFDANGLYENADANYAENRRLNNFSWKIDGAAYPELADFIVDVNYGYYGDGTTVTDRGGSLLPLPADPTNTRTGLLRYSVVRILDNSGPPGKEIRRVVTTFDYNADGEIVDVQVQAS